jgi:putative oxygen-independent coproporphyrinogen III oxidase
VNNERAGLYVHIPFCLTRCGYCDFNAYAGLDHLATPYVDALRTEAELVAHAWEGMTFATVFFGGGTPTTLTPQTIGALIARFRERLGDADGAEITCEANPDTVDAGSLARLRGEGVNRLSMGVQSFDAAVLTSLQRIHSADSARRAYEAAREAGFDNVNLDLIYGAEGETLDSWRRTLDEAAALRPEHLSCYALTVEPNTMLGRQVAAGTVGPPDPDGQADMYEVACQVLGEAGYVHYEVSNWALPGRECLHNLGYWEGRPYLGLGAGAHSFHRDRRWWNVRPPHQYIESLAAGRLPIGGEERIEGPEAQLEALLLGLRLDRGIPESWVPPQVTRDLVGRGLARLGRSRFALTERGMLLASDVVLAVAEASSRDR